jgi:hypothetical protein
MPPPALVEPLTEEFPVRAFAPAFAVARELPTRAEADSLPVIVCTSECVPAAGAVRAMTERFWMASDGLAAWALTLAAPSELCCVGRNPTELLKRAPFKEACVRCCEARLTRVPLTKPLREVVVTARRLCEFTKLKLRPLPFKTFTLRMNVLWTLMTLTKPRLQWNQGKNGSPQPSGNQPTPNPTPVRKREDRRTARGTSPTHRR